MKFDLSDDQRALREAARDALTRSNQLAAARATLDGAAPTDLWPTAMTAGWPGLLVPEDRGGAGLGAMDALLIAIETGRALAGIPLLGHTIGCALLGASDVVDGFADGERRVAFVGAAPPTDLRPGWDTGLRLSGDAVTGVADWVPDAVGADAFAVVALDGDTPVVVFVESRDAAVEDRSRYDFTRSLGRVTFDASPAVRIDGADPAAAWHLAQAWIAAECVGSVETALERSVAYAKDRHTFGRPIGSYQAIKHGLVEMLRRLENARSLVYYAGWAHERAPDQFPLAASAARSAGGDALDFGASQQMITHGGIGVTWEHDAPLYHRRAQVSRRLLGGHAAATDRVAEVVLSR